jgi:hypothetical protein
MRLTQSERNFLVAANDRPHGVLAIQEEDKAALLDLCKKRLVCDPHDMRGGLFTKITDEGKAALAETTWTGL